MTILKLLEFEEGYREKPYLCSNGYPTIGIGQKLGPKCTKDELYHYYRFSLTIKVARKWCLDTVFSIPNEMMNNPDLQAAFSACNNARQSILISMAYQLGVSGLGKFRLMLAAIARQDWVTARAEMLDSKWARKDSPERALRHADQMFSGEWHVNYR